jgi:hypothetical protein
MNSLLCLFKDPVSIVLDNIFLIFIVAPCILKSILFTHQQMHYLLNLESFKILH